MKKKKKKEEKEDGDKSNDEMDWNLEMETFPERGDVVKVGIIIGFRGMFNRVYVSVFVRYLCVN